MVQSFSQKYVSPGAGLHFIFVNSVCEMEWSWFYEPTFHKQSCARIDSILTSIQNRVCEMEWSPVYWAQGHFTNV